MVIDRWGLGNDWTGNISSEFRQREPAESTERTESVTDFVQHDVQNGLNDRRHRLAGL